MRALTRTVFCCLLAATGIAAQRGHGGFGGEDFAVGEDFALGEDFVVGEDFVAGLAVFVGGSAFAVTGLSLSTEASDLADDSSAWAFGDGLRGVGAAPTMGPAVMTLMDMLVPRMDMVVILMDTEVIRRNMPTAHRPTWSWFIRSSNLPRHTILRNRPFANTTNTAKRSQYLEVMLALLRPPTSSR